MKTCFIAYAHFETHFHAIAGRVSCSVSVFALSPLASKKLSSHRGHLIGTNKKRHHRGDADIGIHGWSLGVQGLWFRV